MNIKKVFSVFIIALIGGLTAYGITWFFNEKYITQQTELTHAVPVNNIQSSTVTTLPDFTLAAEKTVNAVVHVKTTYAQTNRQPSISDFFFGNPHGGNPYGQRMPQMASGSGVIISKDGYIITNNHVVESAENIEIVLNDNRTYNAKLIGRDPATDIALIKIEVKDDLPTIPYGNSDALKVGEWVLAVGNPFNLTSTVTAGIVSAKERNINLLRQKQQYAIESFIQTDAAVNPGNSGGALVNTKGELVGINTAIASQTGSYTGYSFAVPVTIVKKVISDLMEFGTVQRALLGINIQDVDSKLAEELELEKPEGVYVANVNIGSAAEDAGIKIKDVIVKINETKVEKVSELQEQISRFSPGDKITVWVLRENKLKKFLVELKNSLGTTEVVNKNIIDVLGATFSEISDSQKEELKIDKGVVVSDIQAGKLMRAGVKPGFIITHVNRKEVDSAKEIEDILKETHGGVYVQGIYPDGNIAYYAFGME